jgi:hypothetical protein
MEVEAAMMPTCKGVSPQLLPDILSEAHQMPLMRRELPEGLRAAFKTIRRQGQEQGQESDVVRHPQGVGKGPTGAIAMTPAGARATFRLFPFREEACWEGACFEEAWPWGRHRA